MRIADVKGKRYLCTRNLPFHRSGGSEAFFSKLRCL